MTRRSQHILSALLYLYFACLILFVPFRWIVGWLFALLIHELGHWIAVVLCGGRVVSFGFTTGGLDMVVTPMSQISRFICILCGPLFGLLPIACYRIFPEWAVFSVLLTLYNLIPIRPLDGGRLIELLLGCNKIKYNHLEQIIWGILLILTAALVLYYSLGILPVAIIAGLVVKNRKITCKRAGEAVQ